MIFRVALCYSCNWCFSDVWKCKAFFCRNTFQVCCTCVLHVGFCCFDLPWLHRQGCSTANQVLGKSFWGLVLASFRHIDRCFHISFVVLAQLVRCQRSLLSRLQYWLEVMTSMNRCLCWPMPRSLRLGLSFTQRSFAHQDVLLSRDLLVYVIIELLSNLLSHLLVCLFYWLSVVEEWLSSGQSFGYWASR